MFYLACFSDHPLFSSALKIGELEQLDGVMTQLNACLHVLMKLDVGFVNDYFFLNEFLSQYSIHQVDSGAGYLQMDCSARLGCFLDFVQFPKSTKNKRDYLL